MHLLGDDQIITTLLISVHNKNLIHDSLALAAKGDERAQREIYDMLAPTLFAISLRYMGNKVDAEDVFQEGFIRIFGSIEKFRGEGSFEGWAKRIMVNMALGHLRKKKISVEDEVEDSPNFAYDEDIVTKMSTDEILALITDLPDGYRSVFNLFAIEGYSHQEVAAMLNITEGNSKLRMNRARKMLQQKVKVMMQVA